MTDITRSQTVGYAVHILIFFLRCWSVSGDINNAVNEADNEIPNKGMEVKQGFGSFRLPSEFLEIEQLKKPELMRSSGNSPSSTGSQILTIKTCTPDALPWIGQTGYCVPTNLLRTYCNDFEASGAVDDCAGYDGNWCCYKPSPTAPPVIAPVKSLFVKTCTPDTHPWVGASGFCASTDQLNTYCTEMEISASESDCPGRENWCCYKTAPQPALLVRQCTPDALTYLGRTGFCAATNQLNYYCNALEISVAATDCAQFTGNWCCYTPRDRPRPTIPPTRPTLPTTPVPPTVAYPNSICISQPNLPQCKPAPTSPRPYYYGATPQYLPCSLFGHLSECTTTPKSNGFTHNTVYGMRVAGPPVQFPSRPVGN